MNFNNVTAENVITNDQIDGMTEVNSYIPEDKELKRKVERLKRIGTSIRVKEDTDTEIGIKKMKLVEININTERERQTQK